MSEHSPLKSSNVTPATPPMPLAYKTLLPHPSPSERAARGKSARQQTPRSNQAFWEAWPERRDPTSLLEEQGITRDDELLPIRYGRMLASPFAFFRGGASIMAEDLASTPQTGIRAQVCGDAHLVNFGLFAAPDRSLVFDINDFDETLPGPWEWDLKRLATSFEVALRERSVDGSTRRAIVLTTVRSYRKAMADFAQKGNLDVWYARLDADAILRLLEAEANTKAVKNIGRSFEDAQSKTNLRALSKLTRTVDGVPRILSKPPLLVPAVELLNGIELDVFNASIHEFLRSYAMSLPDERRSLLEQYEFKQLARKVVGVGSVGMRSWIALTLGRDAGDPLFLQLKQAESSVLERHVGRSRYRNHGRRVVEGQRLMQAASDVLLGWYKVHSFDGVVRDFYVRQLWDGKASADTADMPVRFFEPYARVCAWTLARAHARSGDRVAIAGYLGTSDVFDNAVATFAAAYADQNERDFEALEAAVRSGRIVAEMGI